MHTEAPTVAIPGNGKVAKVDVEMPVHELAALPNTVYVPTDAGLTFGTKAADPIELYAEGPLQVYEDAPPAIMVNG